MSRAWEKAKQGGKFGAIGGAILGAVVGTFVGGPVGTIIFAAGGALQWGLIGGIIGGVVGAITDEPKVKTEAVDSRPVPTRSSSPYQVPELTPEQIAMVSDPKWQAAEAARRANAQAQGAVKS